MRIPKSFQILGHTIQVRMVPDLDEECDNLGRWYPTRNEIHLQSPDASHCKQSVHQALWHEIVHASLDLMGYDKLSNDEKLVDRLGQCLAQVTASMEYK